MRTSSAAAIAQLPGLSEAERASKQSKVKILYIGSAGRSGSTLLDLMLGQGDGMFSTGEVRYLWDRGYLANELCGCGDPFRRCLFSQRVTDGIRLLRRSRARRRLLLRARARPVAPAADADEPLGESGGERTSGGA